MLGSTSGTFTATSLKDSTFFGIIKSHLDQFEFSTHVNAATADAMFNVLENSIEQSPRTKQNFSKAFTNTNANANTNADTARWQRHPESLHHAASKRVSTLQS